MLLLLLRIIGPHNHTISALATALKQAKSPEYIVYQKQVGGYGVSDPPHISSQTPMDFISMCFVVYYNAFNVM
jgi:hypothetical protein